MLAANRLVLDTIQTRLEGELIDSRVDGRVVIEPGARLERSAVRGPAIIGAGARLTDCYVGPVHGDRRGLRDPQRRGRALDPARRLGRPRPRRPDGVLAARTQRQDRPRRPPAPGLPVPRRRQLRALDPVVRGSATAVRSAPRACGSFVALVAVTRIRTNRARTPCRCSVSSTCPAWPLTTATRRQRLPVARHEHRVARRPEHDHRPRWRRHVRRRRRRPLPSPPQRDGPDRGGEAARPARSASSAPTPAPSRSPGCRRPRRAPGRPAARCSR